MKDDLEGKFYEYIYGLGQADEDWNEEVLQFYAPHFAQCHQVLDVGCGKGQLLELLAANGVDARGIDLDPLMVESCREKGLKAVKADLFDYLPQQKAQFDGIFSSNLVEHLSVREALQFLQLAFDALRPGGVLLVATPNPESLIVHLHEFWRDATHVRLYNRSLLEFLLSSSGFSDIQSGGNPKTVWVPSAELQAVPKVLEDLDTSQRPRQLRPIGIFESTAELKNSDQTRPFWRRAAFFLRRRLARFLARTVLFEEFAAVEKGFVQSAAELHAVSVASQRVGSALYQSQDRLLTVPREIFVKGTKPLVGAQEAG